MVQPTRPGRYVLLGVAPPRTTWADEIARWSATGQLPLEFIRCMTADEVRTRLRHGQAVSAVIADHMSLGIDRDLVELTRSAGAIVLGVGPDETAWRDRGVLPLGLNPTPPDVVVALANLAATIPIAAAEPAVASHRPAEPAPWMGRLIAVTGGSGSGTTTTATALAQSLASRPGAQGTVALIDLCIDAQLAAFHDAPDVVPNVLDLLDIHRRSTPSVGDIRALTFDVDSRGYSLLLGTHRHADWTAVRPELLDAALGSLRRAFRHTVIDTHSDFDGESETGSVDIEERNSGSRRSVLAADLIVVTGGAGFKGLLDLTRTIRRLVALGVGPERIIPVITHRPRTPMARAEIGTAIAETVDVPLAVSAPIFLTRRSDLERCHRHVEPLPHSLAKPLAAACRRLLDAQPLLDAVPAPPPLIAPGSLGHLAGPAS